MGAPSPELCNLWLARAFNAQDVDAAVDHPFGADPSWAVAAPPETK